MKYINMAPKDLDKQSAKFKKQYPTLADIPDNWLVEPKYDGIHAMVFTTLGISHSRTSEILRSIPHVEQELMASFGAGWVVFGEIWQPGTEHKIINGAARRESPQPQLQFVVFDAVPAWAFEQGMYDVTYYNRMAHVVGVYQSGTDKSWMPATWMAKRNIFGTLEEEAKSFVLHPCHAYDGVMVYDPNGYWKAGASKNGEAIKVKVVVSLDLKVVGQYAEQKPTKLGGHIVVEYNGVETEVGSGLTQDILNWILCGDQDLVGRVAEIECLGLFPSGKLREPRFKSWRYDTPCEEEKDR